MHVVKILTALLLLQSPLSLARSCLESIARQEATVAFLYEYKTHYRFGDDPFMQLALQPKDLNSKDQKTVERLIERSIDPKLLRKHRAEGPSPSDSSSAVEVGIIVLTTKDGTRIEFLHSSSHPKHIELEHFNASFYEGLKNTGHTQADIAEFSYFHTHPPLKGKLVSQLSDNDHKGLLDMKEFFRVNENEIPVTMYAVEPFRDLGRPVIWTFAP